VGAKAPNSEEASRFVKWLVSDEGQDVIGNFKKDGEVLYSKAPQVKQDEEQKVMGELV
jgi:ABC-type tungstate transport system permease subunit